MSEEEATQLAESGFVKFTQFFSALEMEDMSRRFDCALKRYVEDSRFQLGLLNQSTVRVYRPELFEPGFATLPALERIVSCARDLLLTEQVDISFRLFYKPAHLGSATPWHQDEAYQSSGYQHHSINVWIPMNDVTIDGGCMRYIPDPITQEVHEHASLYKESTMGLVLEAIDVPEERAAAVPLDRGDMVVHHCRTLHSSFPNVSRHPRKALVAVCAAPKVTVDQAPRPWLDAFHSFFANKK